MGKKPLNTAFTHVVVARCEHGHMVGAHCVCTPDDRPKDTKEFAADFLSRGRTISRLTLEEYRKRHENGERFGCPQCSFGKPPPPTSETRRTP